MQRRPFLRGLLSIIIVTPLACWAGVSRKLNQTLWHKDAFESSSLSEAEKMLNFSDEKQSPSTMLLAPDLAENGAIVQIQATCDIAPTESITLFVEHNPTPLIATFTFSNGALPFVVTRIKMAETSDVKAVFKVNNGYLTTSKKVEVLENGCG